MRRMTSFRWPVLDSVVEPVIHEMRVFDITLREVDVGFPHLSHECLHLFIGVTSQRDLKEVPEA